MYINGAGHTGLPCGRGSKSVHKKAQCRCHLASTERAPGRGRGSHGEGPPQSPPHTRRSQSGRWEGVEAARSAGVRSSDTRNRRRERSAAHTGAEKLLVGTPRSPPGARARQEDSLATARLRSRGAVPDESQAQAVRMSPGTREDKRRPGGQIPWAHRPPRAGGSRCVRDTCETENWDRGQGERKN